MQRALSCAVTSCATRRTHVLRDVSTCCRTAGGMCSNAYWTCGVCRALIAFLLSAVTAKYYSEWDENKTGTFLRAEWIEVGSLQQRFCIFAFCILATALWLRELMSSVRTSLRPIRATAYLRPIIALACTQEWMKYHRSFCDAAPKLCTTREDDAQVGYRF